ncbi:MAG: rhombotarget lipoprotein, partial [Pseudomonadota bacterium]
AAPPHLRLPRGVGLGFVPGALVVNRAPADADKVRLMEAVRARFEQREYVDEIVVLPETYLRGTRGIDGMQQVARVFDVDVMALISYDQVITTSETATALLYWTIVGAYVIEGTDHDTRTFVDLAVVDAATSKLLLRAPGFDQRRGDTTLTRLPDATRRTRTDSFAAAVDDMTTNLAAELDDFEVRLKERPEMIRTTWTNGGGGGVSPLLAVVLALLLFGTGRGRHRSGRAVRASVQALPRQRISNTRWLTG